MCAVGGVYVGGLCGVSVAVWAVQGTDRPRVAYEILASEHCAHWTMHATRVVLAGAGRPEHAVILDLVLAL